MCLSGCRRPPAALRVTFLDVGQGDGAVIETPSGKVVVVDAGGIPGTDERLGSDPGSRVVVPFLRWRGISTVDLIVPTHPDDDHVQGLSAVVERVGVRAALDGGLPAAPNTPMARLRAKLAVRKVPITLARRGQRIDLGGGAFLEVLHPADPLLTNTRSDDNNNAIVFRLVYGKSRILFTADAEEDAERSIIKSGADLSADVLKVGHHGSRWSTSAAFFEESESVRRHYFLRQRQPLRPSAQRSRCPPRRAGRANLSHRLAGRARPRNRRPDHSNDAVPERLTVERAAGRDHRHGKYRHEKRLDGKRPAVGRSASAASQLTNRLRRSPVAKRPTAARSSCRKFIVQAIFAPDGIRSDGQRMATQPPSMS